MEHPVQGYIQGLGQGQEYKLFVTNRGLVRSRSTITGLFRGRSTFRDLFRGRSTKMGLVRGRSTKRALVWSKKETFSCPNTV